MTSTSASASASSGIRINKEGWVYISVSGAPFKRGYDYATLIAKDMPHIKQILCYYIRSEYKKSWNYFVEKCKRLFAFVKKTNSLFKKNDVYC